MRVQVFIVCRLHFCARSFANFFFKYFFCRFTCADDCSARMSRPPLSPQLPSPSSSSSPFSAWEWFLPLVEETRRRSDFEKGFAVHSAYLCRLLECVVGSLQFARSTSALAFGPAAEHQQRLLKLVKDRLPLAFVMDDVLQVMLFIFVS